MSSSKDDGILNLLDNARKSEELGRNISTAALLWAVSSVVVIITQWLGWFSKYVSTYEDALPAVVLVTWVGCEISARLPSRVPIAVCGQCRRTSVLPRRPLRRLWPWKRCTYCGGQLNFSCPDGHLLSLFDDEPLVMSLQSTKTGAKPHEVLSIWCSRCGQPSRSLATAELKEHLDVITEALPDELTDDDLKRWIVNMSRGRQFYGYIQIVFPELQTGDRPSRPRRKFNLGADDV